MDAQRATAIINCKNQIIENNKKLSIITKENERLFTSLIAMLSVLPDEVKNRYDQELASDNWKKYSTTQKD
jgi:hypothetical protein